MFDFCDEIVVVDSFSTDKTIEIAKSFPQVNIFQNQFEDFTKQRNFALTHAKMTGYCFWMVMKNNSPA
jgi:glycosyltransferase involved in cell wall biosynthesis